MVFEGEELVEGLGGGDGDGDGGEGRGGELFDELEEGGEGVVEGGGAGGEGVF